MKIIVNKDIFLEKQPEKNFVERLCAPVHAEKPVGFSLRGKSIGEVAFTNVKLNFNFDDECNDLSYTYQDFKDFLKVVGIKESDSGKPINLIKVQGDNPEKFTLHVTEDKCDVLCCDTRGVRRALIFIEDEMKRRSGAFLPLGETVKEPTIKTRISRCFFTPPSHASAEGSLNELVSDIDYYPDAYLNRLAHDGINGLWIGSSFKKMLKSSIIAEFGKEEDVQIAKLNKVVKKCKKFGIGIYLFVTEPASSCYSQEIRSYPDMIGPTTSDGFTLLCPSSPKVQAYINESVTRLFTLVPDLAGLINITVGESLSGCGSTSSLICPKCKEKYGSLAATLAATEKMFSDAMKKVAPNAQFISWTYAQRESKIEDVIESCALRDDDVIHMQNFEDWGRPVQLGKKRLAYDYWLSFAGPGELMEATAKANKAHNKKTFAKIQVCSSHEISTVPYVPAPGILYDKYKFMHENNITGVMQCWYFGNYPSMMNKSAYELSFSPYFKDKDEFLTYLAKTYFGKDYAHAVRAWKLFEQGYTNFPVNMAFEWVGPMQDSPCCPLHLLPADWPMPGTWLKSEMSGGDRIGECLLNGHTIDEAIILIEIMNDCWKQGLQHFNNIDVSSSKVREEQLSNATAIGLIFRSGLNVLKFYKLRHLLGTCQKDAMDTLKQMRDIVLDEIQISTDLIPITENDNRIGYHSEANGYKIFPEKLKWRIEKLNALLETEFSIVEKRIKDGQIPLEFYYGLSDGYSRSIISSSLESANWKTFVLDDGKDDESTQLAVYEDKGGVHIVIKTDEPDCTIKIKPEFHVMFPTAPLNIVNGKFIINESTAYSLVRENLAAEIDKFDFSTSVKDGKTLYTITFDRKTLEMTDTEPFRLAVWKTGKNNSTLIKATKYFISQLIRGELSPEHYCFFVKE